MRAPTVFLALAVLALPGCDGATRPNPGGYHNVIFFARGFGAVSSVAVMQPDGSGTTYLVSGGRAPAISPDGRKLAYVIVPDIFVSPATGAGPAQRLTFGKNSVNGIDYSNWAPRWSPDGRRIAFIRSAGALTGSSFYSRVFVMNADGSDTVPITPDSLDASDPAWSPDGSTIAFQAFTLPPRNPWGPGVYAVAPDGSGLRLVSHPGELAYAPAWAHDGSALAWAGGGGIAVMRLRDSSRTTASILPLAANTLGWAPDDRKFIFASYDTTATLQIFTVNVDGTGLTQLTFTDAQGATSFDPDWAP